jgi:hypothetical protein
VSGPVLKSCRDCREAKPLEAFPLQKGGRHGRHPLCKLCRAAQERRRYARDRDRILELERTDPRKIELRRWSQRRRRSGLGRDDYAVLVWAQSGRCPVCLAWHGTDLRVDHDHTTGRVRGLLCDRCNMAIGHIGDDPIALRAAARFLREHAR